MAELPKHVKLARLSALFKRVFDTEDGREALAELKAFGFLERSTAMVSPDTRMMCPYTTIYNEGKRVLLLRIMELSGLRWEDIERVKAFEEIEMRRNMENDAFGSG